MGNIIMPAGFNALNEEEMMYIAGGDTVEQQLNDFYSSFGAFGAVAIGLWVPLEIADLLWGLDTVHQGIRKNRREGKTGEIISNGIDYTVKYASRNAWNTLLTVYTAANLTVFFPLTIYSCLTALYMPIGSNQN